MSDVTKTQIKALKDQFEKIDQDDPVEIDSVAASLTALHLAIASHTLSTLETSLDQIFICFEISKVMFFYADTVVRNPEFWDEENHVNRMLCSNNFKMAEADMGFSGSLLNHEVGSLQSATVPDQMIVRQTLGLVERYQQLVGRFHEAASILTELDGRKQSGFNLYDNDQRPDLEGFSAEQSLKQLNLVSSQNAEKAIVLNIEAAGHCMAALKIKGSAQQGIVHDQAALILDRFEILEDARDNRYGFTQIRFG